MAELNTYTQVDRELAATADWIVTRDVEKARRRVAALTRKLDFPQSSGGRGGHNASFSHKSIQDQINQLMVFLNSVESQTLGQLQDPQVTHADFSNFRGGM